MILFAEKCGFNYENERKIHKTTWNMPFSSKRKRMSKIIEGKRLFTKGSSEIILDSCNKFLSKSNGISPIDSTLRNKIEDVME